MKYPNVIQCRACLTVLVSFNRHDFKQCGCPNQTFVDGGRDYLRYGGKNLNLIKVLRITTARRKS